MVSCIQLERQLKNLCGAGSLYMCGHVHLYIWKVKVADADSWQSY